MNAVHLMGLLSWLLLFPAISLASSYAPKADFSNVAEDPHCRLTMMQEAFLKHWTPPANFFAVPSYPRTTLTSAIPSGTAQAHGRSYNTLPSAILLSPDAPSTIAKFYRERLGSDWHKAEAMGIIYLYRMANPLASGELLTQQLMSRPGSIPHIAVEGQVTPCDRLLVPGAQARITIVASPR
jgi:hypothetical protein